MREFMFATGIENSCPTITLPGGARHRVDEVALADHYRRFREDFELTRKLGISHLRYGPPYHATHLGPGRYDWSFADQALGALRELGITPIADLCHFGVPDWVGDFQNADWPAHFEEYAGAFAARYPWVSHYTPVNEISIAARFSAKFGWWNEGLKSDRAFVTAIKHLCQANTRATGAIVRVRPDATLIQSESTEYFHAEEPACEEEKDFMNDLRFLALDLTYGYPVSARTYEYLLDHGMTREEYHWFADHRVKASFVMGNDYYAENEHMIFLDGTRGAGEIFGYYIITKEYFDRYHLPVMHTETNADEPHAVAWLLKQWANMVRLKEDGVPIVGFTWYSLLDQVDWDSSLREPAGRMNPRGLCDLDRRVRPVGAAYRRLIEKWRPILPTDSLMLTLGY